MLKRILAAVISAAMVLAMSSCGKDEPKRPEPELTEDGKKIINVCTKGIGRSSLHDDIMMFNRFNKEYEARLTQYGAIYGDEYLTHLNADIMAGKCPDVILYEEEGVFPLESYSQKGMLADFYELMDNDPELGREDFSDVLKAFEWDGKLYRMITSFVMTTAAGKTSIVGEEQGLTIDRCMEIINEYPDNPFSGEYCDGMLWTLVKWGYDNYIDDVGGKCNFESEEFIKLLVFCDGFPHEPLSSSFDEDVYRKSLYAMRNGTMPFSTEAIFTFNSVRSIEYKDFCDPVTFIGYPGAGGNGTMIEPQGARFCVFANSSNSEGGWEFVKYFLTKSYQSKLVGFAGFSVRSSVLEDQAEQAKKPVWDREEKVYAEPYYIDDSGKKVIIGVNTDEDNQRVYDLISGAVEMKRNDNITDIICEEAGAYFSGQKSVEEAAEIIQNRVQNYLDENR